MRLAAITSFALLSASPLMAQDAEIEIPDIAQALLDAAYETGDPDEIRAVSNAVSAVFPDYAGAIDTGVNAELDRLASIEVEETAPAEEKTPDDSSGGLLAFSAWEGKVQVGASFASGNSDNLAVGAAFEAIRNAGNFVHTLTGYIDIAEQNDLVTQKRWGAAYQLDYTLSDRSYVYGRFAYDEDEFSGFDYRLFAGAGAGYFLAKSEDFIWKIEGGPGFRYSPIDLTRETDQNFALYASSEIDWVLAENVTFDQDFNVTWTSPTTTFQSISALTTDLTESLSTAVSFEVRYETDPPFGRENTDTVARASVVYGF